MHKLCNVRKTCLPEAVYLVDFEDRELRVSEFNIHLFIEGFPSDVLEAVAHLVKRQAREPTRNASRP